MFPLEAGGEAGGTDVLPNGSISPTLPGVTFTRVGMGEFLVAYGLSADGSGGTDGVAAAMVWGSVLLTVATVGYLLAIRKHFRG